VVCAVMMRWGGDYFHGVRSVGARTTCHASSQGIRDVWRVVSLAQAGMPVLLNGNGGLVAVGFDECDYEVGERNRKLLSERGLRFA
jgi:hypothetical protein